MRVLDAALAGGGRAAESLTRAKPSAPVRRVVASFCTNYANGCSFGLVDMKLGYRL